MPKIALEFPTPRPLSFPGSLNLPKNSIGIPHTRAPCLSQGRSVFPRASLSVLIPESLEQEFCILPDPCGIVSLCWGFVRKTKLFKACELRYFRHAAMAYSAALPSCSFQLIALFGLWLLKIIFSWYSQSFAKRLFWECPLIIVYFLFSLWKSGSLLRNSLLKYLSSSIYFFSSSISIFSSKISYLKDLSLS